jgi:preprotein translocase subunit SecG
MMWTILTFVFLITTIVFIFLFLKEKRNNKKLKNKYSIKPSKEIRSDIIDLYGGC